MMMQDTSHCLTPQNHAAVQTLVGQLAAYETQLASGAQANAAPIISLCDREDDLAAITTLAEQISARFAHVILCGAGGSGLSGRVLSGLNLYPAAPQLYILDNIDPSAMEALLQRCPLEQSCVIAISKSGNTVETLSQLYALHAHFESALGEAAHAHFILITMPDDNPMHQLAQQHGMKMLPHPANIGGRFSLFTPVGLLPAALAKIDIAALRKGAAREFATLGKVVHPARLGAALQYEAMTRGKNMSVMLPYCERLAGFSAWYRQSWAESLGKSGKGTTPIRAVGTTDQHSQLQLYLDGPDDKFFTMIMHARAGSGKNIHAPQLSGLEYIANKTIGDIMEAEQQATLETLIKHGRPVRLIRLQELNETSLGGLLAHFMLEIFFMAQLLQVNAFDQPAVEEGKQLARQYLLGMGT